MRGPRAIYSIDPGAECYWHISTKLDRLGLLFTPRTLDSPTAPLSGTEVSFFPRIMLDNLGLTSRIKRGSSSKTIFRMVVTPAGGSEKAQICFLLELRRIDLRTLGGPDPRKVDTSGVSYAAWVSVADVSASKSLGARKLHQECRLRVL